MYSKEELQAEFERRNQEKALKEEYMRRFGGQQQQRQPSTLERINQAISLPAALGEGVANFFGYAGQSIANPIEKAMGKTPGQYVPVQVTPNNPMTNFVRGMGTAAPQMMVNPGTAVGRIGAGTAMGTLLNPENPNAGGAEGMIYSGLAEVLPGGFKAARGASEKITRNQFTKDMMDKISNQYESMQDMALSHLKPLMEKYGNKEVLTQGFSNIVDTAKENSQYMTGRVKKSYNDFLDNPTMKNAQSFQSQLGAKERSIKGKEAISINEKEYLADLRDSVLNALSEGFEGMEKGGAKAFNKFRTEYAQNVGPYINDPKIKEVARWGSEKFKETGKSLHEKLGKSLQGKSANAPAHHPLRQQFGELGSKLDRSKAYKMMTGVGPLASHYGYDLSSSILDNPQILQAIEMASPYYRGATKAAMGYQLSPENDLFRMNEILAARLGENK